MDPPVKSSKKTKNLALSQKTRLRRGKKCGKIKKKNDRTEKSVNNPVYLSTGCFTGRVNGRNPRLLSAYHAAFACDGFEWMIHEDFYPRMREILAEYRALSLRIPVVHADKRIGDLLGRRGEENRRGALELFERNLEAAETLGARSLVFHPWGVPESDGEVKRNFERIAEAFDRFSGRGAALMPENCLCLFSSPYERLTELFSYLPETARITFDTRAAQFHGETLSSLEAFLAAGRVGHLHAIDHRGAPGDFEARKTVPQPGKGEVDFPAVFSLLVRYRYGGAITMESPSMRERGVDAAVFNESIAYLRRLGQEAEERG